MTEHEAPNWPDAPRRLVDVWFSTMPLFWLHIWAYMWAFTSMVEGRSRVLSGVDFDALFLTHLLVFMLFVAVAVSLFSCLNVVSRLTRLDPRRYHLLESLNTKPAVTYLRRVYEDERS